MKEILMSPAESKMSATLATQFSAGHDLKAAYDYIIPPGTHCKVDTGVRVAMPPGIFGILCHRSGMNSKQGVFAYGTIDSDYRGIIYATLFNMHPSKEVRIKRGDKVAQLIFVPLAKEPVLYCDESSIVSLETERGEGGHGHSGR